MNRQYCLCRRLFGCRYGHALLATHCFYAYRCLVLKQVVIYGYTGLLKVEARSTGACFMGYSQCAAAAYASHAGAGSRAHGAIKCTGATGTLMPPGATCTSAPNTFRPAPRDGLRYAHFVLFWQALISACFCNALIMRSHWQKVRPFANFIWGALLREVNLENIRILAS
jgi:hypothetical protein